MTQKNDLRFTKTDQAIRQAFLSLLKEKNFDRITVKMIIDKAGINRSTFYAHFLDKFDLMDNIQEELLNNLIDNLPDIHWSSEKPLIDQFQERSLAIIQNINNYRQLVILMLSENAGHSFEQHLQEKSKITFSNIIVDDYLTVPSEYAVILLTSAVSSILTTWVKNGFQESPEEFSNIIRQVMPTLAIQLIHPSSLSNF